MSSISPFPSVGNTPLLPIQKLVMPHKEASSLSCQIYAKCEFRNPSGSIWDRRVSHEINENIHNTSNFVTGGINAICLSLAWAGATSGIDSVSVLPGENLDDGKLQLLQGFGAKVIFSYQQDPDRKKTQEYLESHIDKFEATSGIMHHRILPVAPTILSPLDTTTTKGPYDNLVEELASTEHINKWNVIVSSGHDKLLLETLRKIFPSSEETSIIGVDFTENTFTEIFTGNPEELPGIKTVHISDAECYDMARRLVREEGLMVGPISGGVMAAAMKEVLSSTSTPPATSPFPKTILVILPDSLQNSSRDFLSIDWMVKKRYYSADSLESIFWWYEMAIENMSPPEVLITTPETPIKCVSAAMSSSSTERCVVVTSSGESKRVVGVVLKDTLVKKEQEDDSIPVMDVCTKQFGLIDSTANCSDLQKLLQKYNWIVNMHRVSIYTTSDDQQLVHQTNEDILGVINMADFLRYKKKVESHHLKEYGLSMSDGIPRDIWLEKFAQQNNDIILKNIK